MYSSASSYRFRPLGPGGDADGDLVAHAVPGGPRAGRSPRRPRCGRATIHGGRRSPRRTSRTCRGSRRVCTRRASSTCACPSGPRATSRTSNGPSTASSPAFPTRQLLPALQAVNVNPFEHADRRPRLLSMSTSTTLRRGRRGRARHDRRVHAGPRRRPDRRRRRHLLPRRRLRDPGHGHPRRPRRPPRGLRQMEAAAAAASPRRQHARHRLERPRGHARSATWSSSCRATPAGRSRSWAGTTTPSTTTTARGDSIVGRPRS